MIFWNPIYIFSFVNRFIQHSSIDFDVLMPIWNMKDEIRIDCIFSVVIHLIIQFFITNCGRNYSLNFDIFRTLNSNSKWNHVLSFTSIIQLCIVILFQRYLISLNCMNSFSFMLCSILHCESFIWIGQITNINY